MIFLPGILPGCQCKLEERHQKMTLLMRPGGDDDDLEWKGILEDYRKTGSDRDQQKVSS